MFTTSVRLPPAVHRVTSIDPCISACAHYDIVFRGRTLTVTRVSVAGLAWCQGMYDMGLWLAMRDAIAVVTPYEDLLVDGAPADLGTFSGVDSNAVVSAMEGPDGALLIASSTLPAGLPTSFTVHAKAAVGATWSLCDLGTRKSVPVPASGTVAWHVESEGGTVLLLAATTPCHSDGL